MSRLRSKAARRLADGLRSPAARCAAPNACLDFDRRRRGALLMGFARLRLAARRRTHVSTSIEGGAAPCAWRVAGLVLAAPVARAGLCARRSESSPSRAPRRRRPILAWKGARRMPRGGGSRTTRRVRIRTTSPAVLELPSTPREREGRERENLFSHGNRARPLALNRLRHDGPRGKSGALREAPGTECVEKGMSSVQIAWTVSQKDA